MPFAKRSSEQESRGTSRRGFTSYTQERVARQQQEQQQADSSAAYDTASVQRQIDNARTRLSDADVNVDKDTDRRNWFEKATKLPEGQNWFFDTLDILGRPGQAALGALQNYSNDSGNYLDAAWKGFSGEKRYRGSTIAQNAGWVDRDNKWGKFLAGTALEVVTDPLNLIPGAAVAKAGKLAGTGVKSGAKAAYGAAEMLPGVGRVSENYIRPAAQNVKDGVGFAFNKNYRVRDTLNGGQDNFLESTLRQTENSRKYMQEESLKNTLNAAKTAGGVQTGIDVGRIMESPLRQTDEAGNVLQRPQRALSSNNKIQQAARILTTQNKAISQFARERGIDIPEMEGYMRHVLSKAEREARKAKKPAAIDQGRFGTGNPNKKILAARELTGSAEDINERVGREFFEPNAYFASAIGQKQLIDYVHAVDLRRKVLSNPNFARKFTQGETLGKGEVKIDSNNYSFIKDTEPSFGFAGLADNVGGEYVVTPQVKNALDRYKYMTTDEGTKAMLKAYDAVTNNWKKLALLSPLYHVRNLAGAMFNNYVGGMNPVDLVKYTTEGMKEVQQAMRGKESQLFNAYRQQGLGAESMSNIEFLRSVDPEKQVQKQVERGSKTGLSKIGSKINPLKLPETSREFGDVVDQSNRFALFKYHVDKGATPTQAAEKVREVQFDYSNLSTFENNVMTRIAPFYRWMRFNIPFQLQSFISNPKKYANVNKVRLNAQEIQGLDEETMPDYMKESWAIPVTGNERTGQGKYLGLNLPVGDLNRLSNPGKIIVDSIASPLKLIPELSLNRSTFTNKPIQNYEGERINYDLPGNALDFALNPKAAYTIEQLGGQPARFASKVTKDASDVDQSERALNATLGISSPLKNYDALQNEYYAMREELSKLQEYIKYLENQQGADVRTLNEIKKGSR